MKVKEIAEVLNGKIHGDSEKEICRFKWIGEAEDGDIAVYFKGFEAFLESCEASAFLSCEPVCGKTTIVVEKNQIKSSIKKLSEILAIKEDFNHAIHPTAFIGKEVNVGENVSIGAYSVIGDKVEIGDGTRIFPLVVVYPGVKIGRNCTIHSGVVIRGGVEIGDNVEIDANAVIGSSGFQRGFKKDSLEMPPLCGEVKIGKRVFIGALSNVTKSTLKDTRIDNGTKIDGLVYIGPSAKIGKYCRIAGQTGISEGVIIEDEVSIGGQCRLADAVKVGKKAFIASKSGVLKDVEEHSYVVGIPAMDVKIWKKIQVILRNLPKIWERIRK